MRTRYPATRMALVIIAIVIVIVYFIGKHEKENCAAKGGHTKVIYYGKYSQYLCLTEDGRILE